MKKKILVIVGPTASGKSDLAVRLAKKFNGEIISADSRQVYKGLDIGTGKITKKEMRGIPHYLIDVADPRKQFSVSDYKRLAKDSLQFIQSRNKFSIIVGGTGFYIDALTGRVNFPNIPPNPKLRTRLEKKDNGELFGIIKKKDPRRAKSIDKYNKVRLIRALEIIEKIGSVPQLGSRTSKYHFIFIGLKPDNLNQKIHKRLLKRLKPIIREAKKLIRLKAISYQRMYELGLEYRYAALYLQGKISQKKMIDDLYIQIRRYAKHQMTWFKRNKEIRWFKPDKYKQIERYVRMTLRAIS